jgi:hypothetical protein
MQDKKTQEVIEHITKLPNMTDDEVEEQIRDIAKIEIEISGLDCWLKTQEAMMKVVSDISSMKKRIEDLSAWAKEKGFEKPPQERN